MNRRGAASIQDGRPTRIRYWILSVLFIVTALNYADRATLSIAGPAVSKAFDIGPIGLGYLFSAFGWSYVLGQIPAGWLLDRFGSKLIYGLSLLSWSMFTMLQASIGMFHPANAFVALFVIRFFLGLVESAACPANNRIVAAWFPSAERGAATSIFNSAQYVAVAFFGPLMGLVAAHWGWQYIFVSMGVLGVLIALVWPKVIYDPKKDPRINRGEFDFITEGGALTDLDSVKPTAAQRPGFRMLKKVLSNRIFVAAYIGQYAIAALTYFFITWFPMYLMHERGMPVAKVGFVAAIPAICGFLGGLACGFVSDAFLKHGKSISFARKTPFITGMLLAATMVGCNFATKEWQIVAIMALAFFGKGLAAIGWAVISDTAPKQITGLAGGVFNAIGNIGGIVTPIVSGYIIAKTGSYAGVLVFVAAHALVSAAAYAFLMGPTRRLDLGVEVQQSHATERLSSNERGTA
ncbi:d-galactonate transporter [Caballeronia hypogeia]|uniref:D-galactonate transporter n=1 Tax=Caballeronia hypogeia TaxID=1777140 RepID=A0A158BRJ4_9BURK|nr:MFS transporter [Caballeronia hypogeia]SAK72728.1 d-galactonate transporter [Caballeronia hypogeia]